MKHVKRNRFTKKSVIATLAALTITATCLPLLSPTKVQAQEYTKEEIENMFATDDGGYWYQQDFDTTTPWDGVVHSPEEVAQNVASHGNIHGQYNPNNNQTPTNSKHIFKLKGNVTVNANNSSYVGLFSFSANGQIANVKNRGLANNTPWFTDQHRLYNGHYYYHVATNEWVEDSNVINFVAK